MGSIKKILNFLTLFLVVLFLGWNKNTLNQEKNFVTNPLIVSEALGDATGNSGPGGDPGGGPGVGSDSAGTCGNSSSCDSW